MDYFAIFAGVIVGLMLAAIPGTAGLIAIRLVTVLCEWLFYSLACEVRLQPDERKPELALSGFGNSTVWLIFGAFMFALGYEKTGRGRRVALLLVRAMGPRMLTLG